MPTTYTAPGVYVEEIPSAVQPIAGVGSSTAGFIGIVPDTIIVPFQQLAPMVNKPLTLLEGSEGKLFQLADIFPVVTVPGTFAVRVIDTKAVIDAAAPTTIKLSQPPSAAAQVLTNCTVRVAKEFAAGAVQDKAVFVADYPADKLQNVTATIAPAAGGSSTPFAIKEHTNAPDGRQTRMVFDQAPAEGTKITVSYLMRIQNQALIPVGGSTDTFQLPPGVVKEASYQLDSKAPETQVWYGDSQTELLNEPGRAVVKFATAPPAQARIECDCIGPYAQVTNALIGKWDGKTKQFPLKHYPVVQAPAQFQIGEQRYDRTPINQVEKQEASVDFSGISPQPPIGATIMGAYLVDCRVAPVAAGEPLLCTSFAQFQAAFGGFSTDPGQRQLAHAVQGFFLNGGTRCYVMCVAQEAAITPALLQKTFAPLDEIALVAAPGLTGSAAQAVVAHCEALQDRFAILDSPESIEDTAGEFDVTLLQTLNSNGIPAKSDYAAFYAPWIQVNDPATQLLWPTQKERWRIVAPPSGHIAGLYARVDNERGIHKAPANETLRGAVGLKYAISRAQQAGLNPIGVNCIRELNGSILVWGARTLGGELNNEWKYINVRRLFLYLRESIEEGTQWTVFEPNTSPLWAKITRNVSAFLTNVWRAGALFGNTPQAAFYVKCDAETNPPEVRDLGQVVTEIGVAVTKPAEFVIFRISQWAGASK